MWNGERIIKDSAIDEQNFDKEEEDVLVVAEDGERRLVKEGNYIYSR